MPDIARNRLPRFLDSQGPFSGLRVTPGEGLLASGGGLDPDLVWHAYRHGVFPWYAEGDPVLWWSPDPRAVLTLAERRVPQRLRRTARTRRWRTTWDAAFSEVVRGCAEGREDGTWIHPEMREAYEELHRRGRAHSVEVWDGTRLVGGLYGVEVPPVFCAESMFRRVRDASTWAFFEAGRLLEARGVTHLDAQLATPHLERLGVSAIPRARYLTLLPALLA